MHRRTGYSPVDLGTSEEFIEAAVLGARIAARYYRARGLDTDLVRGIILAQFDADLTDENLNPWSHETVMAAIARELDELLPSSDDRDDDDDDTLFD